MLLPENIKNITKSTFGNKMTNKHICYTNKKRIEINKTMMEQEYRIKRRALILPKLKYDKNSQMVYLYKDIPIIARVNEKKYEIYNNETFVIQKTTKDTIIIKEEDEEGAIIREIEIPVKEFQRIFYVAYCITTHRSQGSTFRHEYSIHEFDLFDHRLKYVALSRSSCINNINIV